MITLFWIYTLYFATSILQVFDCVHRYLLETVGASNQLLPYELKGNA